jgi:hypothetical protein
LWCRPVPIIQSVHSLLECVVYNTAAWAIIILIPFSSLFNFLIIDNVIDLFLSAGDTVNTGMSFDQFASVMGYLGVKMAKTEKKIK